jgi:hypothetical protein
MHTQPKKEYFNGKFRNFTPIFRGFGETVVTKKKKKK